MVVRERSSGLFLDESLLHQPADGAGSRPGLRDATLKPPRPGTDYSLMGSLRTDHALVIRYGDRVDGPYPEAELRQVIASLPPGVEAWSRGRWVGLQAGLDELASSQETTTHPDVVEQDAGQDPVAPSARVGAGLCPSCGCAAPQAVLCPSCGCPVHFTKDGVWTGQQWLPLSPGVAMGNHVWSGSQWIRMQQIRPDLDSQQLRANGSRQDRVRLPDSQRRVSPKWVVLGAVATLGAVGSLAVVGIAGSRPALGPRATHAVSAVFEFSGSGSRHCHGSGGYGDISPETQATLFDGAGAVLSSTYLGAGETVDNWPMEPICRFSFTFPDVPDTDYYQFEVSDRGKIRLSHDEMVANGWTVGGSLG